MRREEQDEKIASMLGGLERVDAPGGFESRVLRRIAEKAPGGEFDRPVLLLMLKFAAPAAMLLLMGLFFVFFGSSEVSNALVPPVQEPNTPMAPATTEAPLSIDGALASILTTESPSVQPPINAARPKPASKPGIMSEDFAVQGPGETFRPDVPPPTQEAGIPSRRFLPVQLLDIIGIQGGCTPANCSVRAVRSNSPAEKAGARESDVVVSIDGRPVDAMHVYAAEKPEISSITVRRDGKIVRLQLNN